MKQRIITGIVGLFLFFLVLFMFDTYYFNVALACVAAVMVHELCLAYGYTKNKLLTIICCAFAAIVPLTVRQGSNTLSIIIIIAFATILVLLALYNHESVKLEQIGMMFFASIIYPFSLTTIIYIRNQFGWEHGIYYTLMIFICAWGSDTGAYFIGRFFGKRKLAPKLSPNKTVEGLIGGVAFCIIFMAIITPLYLYVMNIWNINIEIKFIPLLIISVFGSLLGVAGDLFASMIKRQCGIKDFGSIMPGHGGMLDRFDSTLIIAPFIFVALQFLG